jgi:hypothetical protein
MPTPFENKLAIITGADWSRGRPHVMRFVEKGADTVFYPMDSCPDLDEIAHPVEETGSRIIAVSKPLNPRFNISHHGCGRLCRRKASSPQPGALTSSPPCWRRTFVSPRRTPRGGNTSVRPNQAVAQYLIAQPSSARSGRHIRRITLRVTRIPAE